VESTACFQKPVRFDIVAADRKLSGAAQRRTREGLLHQGSILLPDPQLNSILRQKFPEVFATHFELDWISASSHALTVAEARRADALEEERYATDAWNRMR
jgi:lipoate-protein ligase A